MDRGTLTGSRMVAFGKLEAELTKRCESCCKVEARRDHCKASATQLTKRIIATWEANFGKGNNASDDEVGGYLCWDWLMRLTN